MKPTFVQQIAIKTRAIKQDNLGDIINSLGQDLDLHSVKVNQLERIAFAEHVMNFLITRGVELKEK